ncbi:hypothetical protein F4779DRAFT_323378 [Xylariaceae sp. FL0662B]|nr:hypothetical protein F4779DRAFT_323378 [Xylariaceae sp. FL0662B]
MDHSTLQIPKSGRSRFSKALPAPPPELGEKPETIPRKLPSVSYSPFPPRKDSISAKINISEGAFIKPTPVESPLPALTSNKMEVSQSQTQRNVIPRKPVGLPARPAPTAATKPKKLRRMSSISSILSAYSHTSSDSVQRSSQDSLFTKDSEPSNSPEREGINDTQEQPTVTPPTYQMDPNENETVRALDETTAYEPFPPPPTPPPPMKNSNRPTTPRRSGSPNISAQDPHSTDPSSSPISFTGGSPQRREIWRRRASSKSDRSLAVAELKLAISHGSTASTSQPAQPETLPLPPPTQNNTSTAALPPRSASLPGRDIRPIRQDNPQKDHSMGKFSATLKGLVKRGSKEPEGERKLTKLPEIQQEPEPKIEAKSQEQQDMATSKSPAVEIPATEAHSTASPNPAPTSETPNNESDANSISRPPTEVPRLGLPQNPRPAGNSPKLHSPSSSQQETATNLQDNRKASPNSSTEHGKTGPAADAPPNIPANSNEPWNSEFSDLVASLNQPQISPDSNGKRSILQPQPTRKISREVNAAALSDIGESTEQMTDEEKARLNEGLSRFPRDQARVSATRSTNDIWTPKPLATKHFQCFTGHERWVPARNTNYALACATCGIEDKEPRKVCSFCYLRVCLSCQARLVQKYRGSLKALMDNMDEDKGELRRLEKRREIPSVEISAEVS